VVRIGVAETYPWTVLDHVHRTSVLIALIRVVVILIGIEFLLLGEWPRALVLVGTALAPIALEPADDPA
jgi:hypothetical protein